ncbi:MAG: hypothetical protein GYA43_09525 [Bacteroidales bacterium]|nr:hypothetical protein [Bacteroidales bacterium]
MTARPHDLQDLQDYLLPGTTRSDHFTGVPVMTKVVTLSGARLAFSRLSVILRSERRERFSFSHVLHGVTDPAVTSGKMNTVWP